MSRETQRFRVGILAWCLMTNHVHLIAVPEDERPLARAIGEAHKRYSRRRNFAEGVRGLGEQKVDVLVKDRNLLGLVANGREFLQGEDSGGEKDLRRATKTGRPLFDHEHLERIEKKTGRNLQKGKPGRKPPDSMK